MVPKNLAVSGPDRAVLMFGPPLVWVARIVRPVILGLNWLANHALRAVGVEPKAEVSSAFTAEEVQSIVERSQAEGLLEDSEGLLRGAIEFSDRTAGDVMVATDELTETTGLRVPDDGPYETLGGLLMARLGRIPTEGDSVEVDGVLLQVERMAGRRVERLRVVSLDDGSHDDAADDRRGERA